MSSTSSLINNITQINPSSSRKVKVILNLRQLLSRCHLHKNISSSSSSRGRWRCVQFQPERRNYALSSCWWLRPLWFLPNNNVGSLSSSSSRRYRSGDRGELGETSTMHQEGGEIQEVPLAVRKLKTNGTDAECSLEDSSAANDSLGENKGVQFVVSVIY